ncbi:phytanoyl-CoA dioxygenase family protein [Minwuia sp.]|uniref:phytanoyl-CoA dioxygenase family protein n=1 Tax=Minwuia sp. TaxID=2493630 RepID=UPI003A92EC46
MLTEAEVAHYHEQGFVVPQNYRVPEATLQAMRRDLDRLIETNPHVKPDAMFTPHEIDHGTQGLKGDPVWLDYAAIPEILDMVEQVIGPDFLLWGTTVFGKPAHSGKETPWHQDGEYWPIRPLATCSVWIAMDEATPENGCLRVIPGSHRQKNLLKHDTNNSDGLTLNQQLKPEEYREEDAHDIVLEPGQISLHDIYMVHGSKPNTSPKRRAGYVLRFMPTTSHFDRALGAEITKVTGGSVDFVTRPLYLMRGRDVHGGNDIARVMS